MQGPFTTREVIQFTGITPRQLQWWDERELWFRHGKGIAACIRWKTWLRLP